MAESSSDESSAAGSVPKPTRSFSVDEGALDEFDQQRFRQLTVEYEEQRARDEHEEEEGGGDRDDSAANKSPFYKVGLLTKLGGGVKNWLERGFALRRDYKLLHYFRSAEDFQLFAGDSTRHAQKVAGTLNLVGATMYLAVYVEYGNCVEVTTAREVGFRHYYMYARTRAELQSWISALTECGVTYVTPSALQPEMRAVSHPDSPVPVYGMQGFVEKRGGFNTSFKLRFFRIEWDEQLRENVVAYFARFDDTKRKGCIRLAGAAVEGPPDGAEEPDREWRIATPSRVYTLRCSPAETRQWGRVLARFIPHPERPAPEVTVVSGEEEKRQRRRDGDVVDEEEEEDAAAAAEEEKTAAGAGERQQEVAAPAAAAEPKLDGSAGVSVGAGGELTKVGSGGVEGRRHVWVEGARLYWDECEDADARKATDDRSVALPAVLLVSRGKDTNTLASDAAASLDAACCFSVVTAERSVDFVAGDEEARDKWVAALRHAVRVNAA